MVSSWLSSSAKSMMILVSPRAEVQPKFSVFQQCNCTLVDTSLTPFGRLFLSPAVYECALIPEFAACRRFVERPLWTLPLFTKKDSRKYLSEVLSWHASEFPDGLRPLGLIAFALNLAHPVIEDALEKERAEW